MLRSFVAVVLIACSQPSPQIAAERPSRRTATQTNWDNLNGHGENEQNGPFVLTWRDANGHSVRVVTVDSVFAGLGNFLIADATGAVWFYDYPGGALPALNLPQYYTTPNCTGPWYIQDPQPRMTVSAASGEARVTPDVPMVQSVVIQAVGSATNCTPIGPASLDVVLF